MSEGFPRYRLNAVPLFQELTLAQASLFELQKEQFSAVVLLPLLS
jgi:hypothetical protein